MPEPRVSDDMTRRSFARPFQIDVEQCNVLSARELKYYTSERVGANSNNNFGEPEDLGVQKLYHTKGAGADRQQQQGGRDAQSGLRRRRKQHSSSSNATWL